MTSTLPYRQTGGDDGPQPDGDDEEEEEEIDESVSRT